MKLLLIAPQKYYEYIILINPVPYITSLVELVSKSN